MRKQLFRKHGGNMFIHNALIYTEVLKANHPQATIIITHGLAQHSDDYKNVAKQFNKAGYHVMLYDLRGHGRSQGKRGSIKYYEDYLNDLDFIYTYCEKTFNFPVFLIGHSMGGILTNLYALKNPNLKGVIISAAPYQTPKSLNLFKVIGYRPWGFLKFKTNFQSPYLSNIPYEPRINPFDIKTFRLRLTGEVLIRGIKNLRKNIKSYQVPVLLLYGKEDVIVSYQEANHFFEDISSEDKTLKLYPNTKHNVFQEQKTPEVISDVIAWIDEHIEHNEKAN